VKIKSRNNTVVVSCLAVVIGMTGLSYAAVPLYDLFCRATGYGGTPQRADAAPSTVNDRVITVRFDTNTDRALPWLFQPEQRSVQVKVGENRLVFFRAVNNSDRSIVGHATFNVVPDRAGRYFSKIQCFCFTEQRLDPGQSVDMPVSFFIAPAILTDRDGDSIQEITLSYTFYPAANQKAVDKTTPAVQSAPKAFSGEVPTRFAAENAPIQEYRALSRLEEK
jgi:cytochrome c oxidase assembly protein subunit 11